MRCICCDKEIEDSECNVCEECALKEKWYQIDMTEQFERYYNLLNENGELKVRLEKSIELPCIREVECRAIKYWYVYFINDLNGIDNYICDNREQADARVKELEERANDKSGMDERTGR